MGYGLPLSSSLLEALLKVGTVSILAGQGPYAPQGSRKLRK